MIACCGQRIQLASIDSDVILFEILKSKRISLLNFNRKIKVLTFAGDWDDCLLWTVSPVSIH